MSVTVTIHTQRATLEYIDMPATSQLIDPLNVPFTICRISFSGPDVIDRVDLLLPYGGRIEGAKP